MIRFVEAVHGGVTIPIVTTRFVVVQPDTTYFVSAHTKTARLDDDGRHRCKSGSSRNLGGEAEHSRRGVADEGHGAFRYPLAERRWTLHQTFRRLVKEILHSSAQLFTAASVISLNVEGISGSARAAPLLMFGAPRTSNFQAVTTELI